MKIEVLTIPDCPNRSAALDHLREAVRIAGLSDVVVTERRIDDPDEATSAGMHGSPTILLDGRDPFADGHTEPSLSCRLYRAEGGVDGAPSVAALVDALK